MWPSCFATTSCLSTSASLNSSVQVKKITSMNLVELVLHDIVTGPVFQSATDNDSELRGNIPGIFGGNCTTIKERINTTKEWHSTKVGFNG